MDIFSVAREISPKLLGWGHPYPQAFVETVERQNLFTGHGHLLKSLSCAAADFEHLRVGRGH